MLSRDFKVGKVSQSLICVASLKNVLFVMLILLLVFSVFISVVAVAMSKISLPNDFDYDQRCLACKEDLHIMKVENEAVVGWSSPGVPECSENSH